MRIERELMRGAGPVAVLKLLEKQEMYGYELVQTLEERSAGVLAMGQSTLYPLLYNLEAKGYIKASWRDGETGRQRKYYALTGKGKKRLTHESRQWRELTEAMRAIGIVPELAGNAKAVPA